MSATLLNPALATPTRTGAAPRTRRQSVSPSSCPPYSNNVSKKFGTLGRHRVPRGDVAAAAAGGSDDAVQQLSMTSLPALQPWAQELAAAALEASAAERERETVGFQEVWAGERPTFEPVPVLDLLPPNGEPRPPGPFETTVGAFFYDKGYRQLFRGLGYPGLDLEAEAALVRLNAAAAGGVCLDVSCGPGIISRRLATGRASLLVPSMFACGVPVYPHTLAASSSMAWPLATMGRLTEPARG
jgi:hypothetical protein